MQISVFTIVSRNYFAYARTLGDSLRASNPDVDFNVLVVDRKDPKFALQHPDWKISWVEDLGISNFENLAFKYDILELNTNVKPSFAKQLLQQYSKVIYLDPDVFVYASLQGVIDLLDQHAVVLTPHITQPIDDDKLPAEQAFLLAGIYNLGFAAFNRSAESLDLLSWWEQRCLHLAYNEQAQGFFVDQKWMDFVPAFCASAHILRKPQYNVAYWNLYERSIELRGTVPFVAGQPLVFFHFSGLPPLGDRRISKYQTRYSLQDRPDVAPLFTAYRQHLQNNGHADYSRLPYGFGAFSDGIPVTGLARRVAAGLSVYPTIAHPFDAQGRLYRALRRSRLLQIGPVVAGGNSVGETAHTSLRLTQMAGVVSRILLWVFGPIRYEGLMRYVVRTARLRSQSFLIRHDL